MIFLAYYPTILFVSFFFHNNIYPFSFFETHSSIDHIVYTTYVLTLTASIYMTSALPKTIHLSSKLIGKGFGKFTSIARAIKRNRYFLFLNTIVIIIFFIASVINMNFYPLFYLLIISTMISCLAYGLIRYSQFQFIVLFGVTITFFLYLALLTPGTLLTPTLRNFGIGGKEVQLLMNGNTAAQNGTLVFMAPNRLFFRPDNSDMIRIIPNNDDIIVQYKSKKLSQ